MGPVETGINALKGKRKIKHKNITLKLKKK